MFSGTPQRCRIGWVFVFAVPGSEQLRRPGAWRAHSIQVQCILSPPQSQPLGFWVRPCQVCLFWGADLWLRPSQQMSIVQNLRKSLVRNWKPVRSLVGDALSGAEFAPFRLWLAPSSPVHLVGDRPVSSWLALLWYCSVPCSVSGPAVP